MADRFPSVEEESIFGSSTCSNPITYSNPITGITALAQDLHTKAMIALYESGEDSDFTVKCDNRTWQLHRIILRSGSEYFKHACSGKFQEGASGIIELKEEDPRYAGILLRYFYALDYQIDTGGIPASVAHARVYAIADKYGVGLLKDLARARFALAVGNTVATDIADLIAATEVVYATTPSSDRGLRNSIKPKLMEFKQQLRDNNEFMALFVSGLGGGNFAVEMLDAWAGLNPKRRDYLWNHSPATTVRYVLPA